MNWLAIPVISEAMALVAEKPLAIATFRIDATPPLGSPLCDGLVAVAAQASEALALEGGPQAITFPADMHTAVTRWPRYGAAEKQALHDLIDRNT